MSLRMATPRPNRLGIYTARIWVPTDLQTSVGAKEVVRSLGTRDPAEAKRRHKLVTAEFEDRWEELRAAADFVAPAGLAMPEPRAISDKEAHALGGEFYRALVAEHEENPGSPDVWEKKLAAIQRSLPRYERIPGMRVPFADESWNFHHTRNAFYALGQEVRKFLDERGDNLDRASFVRLCAKVALAKRDAFEHLLRNARGDFSPDPKAGRFPAVRIPDPVIAGVVADAAYYGYAKVAEAWYAAGGIAPKTRKSWVGKLRMVTIFAGKDDLAEITQDDVLRWREQRLKDGISPRTISYADMAGPRAIYNWAIKSRLYPRITVNPFADMAVKVRKKKKTREQGFTSSEANIILRATLVPVGDRFTQAGAAARRWCPWLAAYSGARIAEITQLHADNVVEEKTPGGLVVWIMTLTPDDGSIKSGEFRKVPLHPHLIEQGFLNYLKIRRGKPLFYEPDLARVADPANTQADKAGQRLAEWVRGLGIVGVAPNHGWRHRLKTNSRSYGVDRDVGNYLTGHSAEDVAAEYGDYLIEVLYREVCKLPRYEVEGPREPS